MHDVFFFTDIHGCRPLFDTIMDYCISQDPECSIIFGGDAIDRGPDGYRIMKELLDNPQVIYLKGNHEDMFTKAAREIKEKFNLTNRTRDEARKMLNACRMFDYRYAAIQDSLGNGSIETLLDWIEDGAPLDIVERVENLPLTFSYEKYDFCHAGGIYRTFKKVADAEYNEKIPDEYAVSSVLWNRSAMNYEWENGRIAIFGHTPTPYLSDYLDNFKGPEDCDIVPVKWNKNNSEKLDMDTGAVFTGRAYVLNVLTMKAQGFEDKDFENKEICKHDIKKIKVIQF